MRFSTNKITQKELNNSLVEFCLSQDEREKVMVKKRKELGYVEYKGASWKVFDPTWANDVCQHYACIYCRLELETSKLTSMDEIIGYCMKLESVTNDFFNKFVQDIKQNIGLKDLDVF